MIFYSSLNYKNRIRPMLHGPKSAKRTFGQYIHTVPGHLSGPCFFVDVFNLCYFKFYFETLHIFYQALKLDLDPLFYLLGFQP